MDAFSRPESTLAVRIRGTLVHSTAIPTAADASTTPNPYSSLNSYTSSSDSDMYF